MNRAREAGVGLIINIGIGLQNSHQVVETAHRYHEVFAAVGVHPHAVAALTARDLEALAPVALDERVVAIGEIGLDFYRRRSPEEEQRYWFRQFLEWAVSLKKAVVVHTREATADTLQILRDYSSRLVGGVMHCFSGSLEEAYHFLDLGFYLSFSGVLTYPPAEPLRQVARQLPLDRVLMETDCPYLAPQPWRGKRNEPAYVTATAQTLAKLHGLSLEEVAHRTYGNTLSAFNLVGKGQPGKDNIRDNLLVSSLKSI